MEDAGRGLDDAGASGRGRGPARRSAWRRACRCGRRGRSGFRRAGSGCRRRRRSLRRARARARSGARSAGAISAASPIRVGVPGFSRIAPSGRTKAGSSTKTASGIVVERRERLDRQPGRLERGGIGFELGQHALIGRRRGAGAQAVDHARRRGAHDRGVEVEDAQSVQISTLTERDQRPRAASARPCAAPCA